MNRGKWMRAGIGLVLSLALTTTAQAATYMIDADHTRVGFTVRHMFTNLSGSFKTFSGSMQMDTKAGTISAIKAVVETASVDTHHQKRDSHLRDADFFDVKKHPSMTFTGKQFKKSGGKIEVTGDFTLLGVTRPVTFTTEILGEGKDPWGNVRAGLTAYAKINRKDFGMDFNKVLDTGGLLIGEEVTIVLEIEAIRK